MKKRILSFVLALCFVFTLLPAAFADSEPISGTDGDNIAWVFDNGTLTVSGSGEMSDCTWYAAWDDFKDQITKLVIEQGVTTVGAGAFDNCTALTTVVLPESLETIDFCAFSSCTALESITLPGSLKNIGQEAFENCTSLKSITIPSGVTEIGYGPFFGCTALESINAAAENGTYSSENGVLLNKEKTVLIAYPAGKTDAAYAIPSSIVTINNDAFHGSQFKSVTIPDGLKTIGYAAFYACKNLESVTVPDSVISVSHFAFNQCTALKTATMPNGVSTISYGTFNDCTSLKSVTVPSSVKSIEGKAFYNCTGLSDVYYKGTSAQWNAVEIVKDTNTALDKATVHFEEHTHSYTTAVTAPTCTEKGYTTHTCACGDSYKDTYTKALGHSYKNGKCTRCGAADPKYIAAPALKITTVSGHPKIYWNSVDGAYKYWVYRSTDGKNYKYYDSTTKTTYTNNSTTIAQRYWYKVKAVKVVNGNNYASVYSNSDFVWVSTKAPTLKITTYKGDPKITWNSVSGAKLYWVFVSTDGKTYYFLNETKNTSYIDKNVKAGKKYYYKVQAVALYNGTFAIPSAYSYPVSITAK